MIPVGLGLLADNSYVVGIQHFGSHQGIEFRGVAFGREEITESWLLVYHHRKQIFGFDRLVLSLKNRDRCLHKFAAKPLFLVLGAHLIKRQTEISEGKEKSGMKLGAKIGISVVPCVLLFAGGIALMVMSMNH